MANRADPVQAIAALAAALEAGGFEPVLVGGMALVVLGSQRVTRDFDILVSAQGALPEDLMRIMYHHRLELVTKFNDAGEAVRTVDNPRVAASKVKAERPSSVFFADRKTGLRVDLLLDFPLPAHRLARRATKVRVKAGSIPVASPEDLLQLKELACAGRKSAADLQDVEFLRRMLGLDS